MYCCLLTVAFGCGDKGKGTEKLAEILNNDEQIFWSGPSGQSWIAHETVQDRLLSEATQAVMERVGLATGRKVLDIGCGTGALSVAAADAVGSGGRVLATDISPPMLNRAAERLGGKAHASTLLADAEVVDWPETGFDAAISRFGVMFFSQPWRAFANISRALRSDGRMVFATWGPVEQNVYWRDPARIAADRLGKPPSAAPNAPGPMGMADIDWSIRQLRAAGLDDVACEKVEAGLPVDGSPADAADLALAIGPAARVIRLFEASEADAAAIHADIARDMEQYRDGDTVRIPAVLHLYTARVA